MIRPSSLYLLLPVLVLSACNSPASIAVPGATGPSASSPTVPDVLNSGTYEVTFQGVGSANPTVGVQSSRSSGIGAQRLVSAPEQFTFTRVAVSTFAVDVTQTRHVQATFRVTNNTAQTLLGLKFVPVSTTQDSGSSATPTVGNTPFKNVRLFDGSDASSKATDLTPTQGQIFDTSTGTARRDLSASLYRTGLNVRGLTPDKPSGLTISSIKPYGWEVASLAPGDSTNVTFAVDVPMDPAGPSKDPFSFSLVFVPARENVILRSAVQQYDPASRQYGNYILFPVLNSRSLPAYYDLQGDVASVLCSFDSALKVQNISSGAFPNRYRVEVQGLRNHDLLVFPGTACPAGAGTPILTQTVTGVPLRPRTEPIAGGYLHSLALKADGTVQAWGHNVFGQLGNGSTTNTTTPVVVPGLTDVVSLQAGGVHSLALKVDGTVQAWGRNVFGQLGNGSTTDSSTPVVVAGLTDVVSLQAGDDHSLALKTDGTVQAWGRNAFGQLGNGTTTNSSTPVPVSISGVAQPTP